MKTTQEYFGMGKNELLAVKNGDSQEELLVGTLGSEAVYYANEKDYKEDKKDFEEYKEKEELEEKETLRLVDGRIAVVLDYEG